MEKREKKSQRKSSLSVIKRFFFIADPKYCHIPLLSSLFKPFRLMVLLTLLSLYVHNGSEGLIYGHKYIRNEALKNSNLIFWQNLMEGKM